MAKSAPQITDAKIQRWVGATFAQRGRAYQRGGHVVDIRWRGDTLTGRVQGSEYEPYRVSIQFDGSAAEGDCSCPVGYNCKHVAALLYAAMESPRRVPRAAPIEKRLAKLEKPALLALVRALLAEAPELEDVIEVELMTVSATPSDSEALRDHVRRLLAQAGDWDRSQAVARNLDGLIEGAKRQLDAGQPEAACAILQALASELMLMDWTELGAESDLLDVFEVAVEHLLKGWRALPVDHAARREALRTLFEVLAWDLQETLLEIDDPLSRDLAKSATPDERDLLREWIALAIRQPPRPSKRAAMDEYDDEDDYGYEDEGHAPDDDVEWRQDRWRELERKFAAKAPAARAKSKSKGRKPKR
jgi:hypothetical protein